MKNEMNLHQKSRSAFQESKTMYLGEWNGLLRAPFAKSDLEFMQVIYGPIEPMKSSNQ